MRYLFCKCGLRIYFRLFSGIPKLKTKVFCLKLKKEQDEFISQTKENPLTKFSHDICSSKSRSKFWISESIAIHRKPFSEGEFLKQAWLACEPKLLYLQITDTILLRVKDRTRNWNKMELKLNNI